MIAEIDKAGIPAFVSRRCAKSHIGYH